MFPRLLWALLPRRLQDRSTSDRSADGEATLGVSSELLFVSGNLVLFCGCLIMVLIKIVFLDHHILLVWLAALLACLCCLVLFKLEIWSVHTGRVIQCYMLAASQFAFITSRMSIPIPQPARFLHMLHMQNPVLILILSWTIAPNHFHFFIVMFCILGAYLTFGLSTISECSSSEVAAVSESMVGVVMSVLTVAGYLAVADVILRMLIRKSAAASVAKDLFLQKMSHELRTPLAAIIGFIDTFSRGRRSLVDEATQLMALKVSAQMALDLVDQVLDWSQIRNDVPKKERFSLLELRESTLILCSQSCKEKQIDLEVRVRRDSLKTVRQDLARVRQVLVGLVGNSIKFCSIGGKIRVSIGTELAREATSLSVSVQDNGVGFDIEDPEYLFKPFVQLGDKGKGVGLGLAISKDVVTSLGGSISASSPGIGQGACFCFSVPCDVEGEQRQVYDEVKEVEVVSKTAIPKPGSPLRVLCVEDSSLLLMILVKYLKQMENEFQLQVEYCSSGVDALPILERAFASNQPYRLVLTDILMDGGVDGCELALLIRAKEDQHCARRCRIVGISAMTDDNTRKRGFRSGFDNLLKKPVSPDLLRAEVVAATK